LGDRVNMTVAKLVSPDDYKNYQQKEKTFLEKLLTKEQFEQKCTENPEFLWQFAKIANRFTSAGVDSTQTDMHRAINQSRTPSLFGELK